MPPDQRVHQVLLALDELEAVSLELLARCADSAHGLALVDETANPVAERLDAWKLDDCCAHDRLGRSVSRLVSGVLFGLGRRIVPQPLGGLMPLLGLLREQALIRRPRRLAALLLALLWRAHPT